MKRRITVLMAVAALGAGSSHAALITSLNNGKIIPFETDTDVAITSTPIGIAAGIFVSSSGEYGGLLSNQPRALADNGVWTGYTYIASETGFFLGEDENDVTFTFETPVAGVGGFLNFASFELSGYSAPTLTALGAGGNALEGPYNLAGLISTPGGDDAGRFFGIYRSSTDIYGFRMENSGITITDLTILAEIPEPSTFAVVCFGIIIMAAFRLKAARGGHPRWPVFSRKNGIVRYTDPCSGFCPGKVLWHASAVRLSEKRAHSAPPAGERRAFKVSATAEPQ